MPLHDAVGINCKPGATAENQGADVKNMAKVVEQLLKIKVKIGHIIDVNKKNRGLQVGKISLKDLKMC